jgi:hypothetical protein
MNATVKGDQTTVGSSAFAYVVNDGEAPLMGDSSFRQDLQGFAVELRQLAYTMPAGHEDRLIHLSERMVERSRQNREADRRGA